MVKVLVMVMVMTMLTNIITTSSLSVTKNMTPIMSTVESSTIQSSSTPQSCFKQLADNNCSFYICSSNLDEAKIPQFPRAA